MFFAMQWWDDMSSKYSALRDLLSDFNPDSPEGMVCGRFVDYLFSSEGKNLHAHGVDLNEPWGSAKKEVDVSFGYPHRWTDQYIRGRFAKLYRLEEWYATVKDTIPCTFLSMTISHPIDPRYSDIVDGFEALQRGKHLFLRELRHMGFHGFDYLGVAEPHENGFPHYHFILFLSLSVDQQNHLRTCWEKWGMGSFEHGLDFDERPAANISSIRNYLMKYMVKSLPGVSSRFGDMSWSPSELLFNSVAWEQHRRTWFSSQELGSMMAYHPETVLDVHWEAVLLESGFDSHVLYYNPSQDRPVQNPHMSFMCDADRHDECIDVCSCSCHRHGVG